MFKFTGILVFIDTVAALASYYIGQYVRFGGLQYAADLEQTQGLQVINYVIVILLSGYFCELYTVDRFVARSELASRIAVTIMIAFFVLAAFYYAAPGYAMGRGVLSLSLLIFGVLQYVNHRCCQFVLNFSRFSQKIMILGTGPLAEVMERVIPNSEHNYVFAGFIQPENGESTVSSNLIVGAVNQLEKILSREKVDKLVVSLAEKRGALPVKDLLTCKMKGIEIFDPPTFYEKMTGKLLVEDIPPSWFIYSSGFRLTPFRRGMKRALDLLLSFVGILLVLPFLPVIALLIKATSPGPVLFRQDRVGEGGKEFTLIKFRTMCDKAEKDTGAVWASEDDPRITGIGRWLRKLRIDEIPQLFNVLKGEMSFIGPRPERREFVDKLSEKIPYYSERHSIKPGVTGWAQIKYPYGATEEDALEKLRYDLFYIKNYSITLDLMIVLGTIKVVIFGRGGR